MVENVLEMLGWMEESTANMVKSFAWVKMLREKLTLALDSAKEIETRTAGEIAIEANPDGTKRFPNAETRSAELLKRLAENKEYQALQENLNQLRAELVKEEIRLEHYRSKRELALTVLRLTTALVEAGKAQEAEEVLEKYARSMRNIQLREEPDGKEENLFPEAPVPQTDGGMEELKVRVLEARRTKADTVRVYCEGPAGKVVVYAKNGTAEALLKALGNDVVVRAKKLDKGYFAVQVCKEATA